MEAPVLIGSSGDMTVIGRGGGGLRWAVRTYSGSFAAAAAALPAAGFLEQQQQQQQLRMVGSAMLRGSRAGMGWRDTP
ncbi:MAG: hypothetical protein BSK19_04500 [Stenotrophomonas maltophilia]|nr:MAG: hypothetical protein BSK19_04500 [Stenotrophomonas maltophilia]